MKEFRPLWALLSALALVTTSHGVGVNAETQAANDAYLTTSGYFVSNVADSGTSLKLQLERNMTITNSTYGDDIDTLVVEVTKSSYDAVRVKIADDAAERWQVPSSLYSKGLLGSNTSKTIPWSTIESTTVFSYTPSPFTFQVARKSDGYVLFDSSALSLAIKDKYLQVATAVSDDINVYGFGESTQNNMRVKPGDKRTLWARDQGSAVHDTNLYGSHPFFMGINGDGKAHGVFLLNS
ncbi:hypothetical protein PHMEG_00039060, partial [Phytophthora megakarya]